MLGMKKSGQRLVIVPPQLAYGAKGVPNRIPANSTLVFEVELQRVPSTEPFLLSSPSKQLSFPCSNTAERMWFLRL